MKFALSLLPYSVLPSDLTCDPNYSFFCEKPALTISSHENACLQYLVACDGERDCQTVDDETHCDLKDPKDRGEGESKAQLCSSPEVSYLWTQCKSTPTVCIPKSSLCDGINDCDDESDEESCSADCSSSCDDSSTCQALFNETEPICKCDEAKSINLLKEFDPEAPICIEKEEKVQYEIESFVYIKDDTFYEEDQDGKRLYTSIFSDVNTRAPTFDDNSSLFCFIRLSNSDLMCFLRTPDGDYRWDKLQFNNFQEYFNINEIHKLSLHTNLQQIYFTGPQTWLCQLNFDDPDESPKCIFLSDRSEVEVGLDPLRNLRFIIDHPLIGALEHSRTILTNTFFDIAALELDGETKRRLFMLSHLKEDKSYAIHQITVSYEQRKIFVPYFAPGQKLHVLVHDYNGQLLDDIDLSQFEKEEHGKIQSLLQVLPDMSFVVNDKNRIYTILIDEETQQPTIETYDSLSISSEVKIVIKREDVTLPEKCPEKDGALALRSGDGNCKYLCYSSTLRGGSEIECNVSQMKHSDDLFFMANVGNHHSSSISFYDFEAEEYQIHAGLVDDSHPLDGLLVKTKDDDVIAILSGHVRAEIMYRSLESPSRVKTLTYLPVKSPSAMALDPARQTVFFFADGRIYASSIHKLKDQDDDDLNYIPITSAMRRLGDPVSMAVDSENGRIFLLYVKDLSGHHIGPMQGIRDRKYLAALMYVDLKDSKWSPPQTRFMTEIVPDIVVCANKLFSIEDRKLCAHKLGVDSAFVTFFGRDCFDIDSEDIFVEDKLMRMSCHKNTDLYLSSNNNIYKLDLDGSTSLVRTVPSARDLVLFDAIQKIDPAPRACADAQVEYFDGEKTICKCYIGYTMNENHECEKNANPKASLVDFCFPSQFYCHNHKCINQNYRCDGKENCGDYSDELGCDKDSCSDDEFKCESGKCISKSAEQVRLKYDNYQGALCDGVRDCPGGEDELEENCDLRPEITCSVDYLHHLCADKRQCINSWDVCNGEKNCYDGSDEENCESDEEKRQKCPDGFSKCNISGIPADSRVLCARNDEADKIRACEMKADSDPALLVFQTPSRIFTLFGKSLDVVETVPQGTNELAYAALLKSSLVLVHESSLLNNSFPIVHIGPVPLTWGKPEFSMKLVSKSTKMRQFRFSEAFNTNYYRTTNPEAIWNEASEEISKNPSLIFMAKENQKIIQMQLVNCIDTIFALIRETKDDKDSYFIVKLPGYDFTADAGYKIEIPDEKVYSFAVTENRLCVVLDNSVQCKEHDDKKWRKLTDVTGDTAIQASNGIDLFFILERKDSETITMRKFSGSLPEKGGPSEIKFSGDLLSVDITVPHTECNVEFCKVDTTKSIATSVIGPHNGGCEHICEFDKTKADEGMGHRCKCQKGFALAKDTKTCFRHQLGEASIDFPINPSCPANGRFEKVEDDDHVWLCPDMNQCIDLESRCDGTEDCEHGADESFCDNWHREGAYAVNETSENWHEAAHIHCPVGFYRCQNGQCIEESKILFIDGDDDSSHGCYDGSHIIKRRDVGDAYYCTMTDCDGVQSDQPIPDPQPSVRTPRKTSDQTFSNCAPDEWKCPSSGECIKDFQKCDGIPDCEDIEDEEECEYCNGVFSCFATNSNDKKCVPNEKICDGEKDCLDGNDEVKCDDALPKIDCSAGEYLNLATQKCVKTDDEHCSVGHLPCSQKCVPTEGKAPVCKCVYGYSSDENGICRVDHEFASETYKPQIIFGNQKNFARLNFEEQKAELFATKQSNVVAFDYNYRLSEFYWASVDGSQKGTTHIRAIKADSIHDISKLDENLFIDNVKSYGLRERAQIDALSVDWITGNIYFGDKINGKLFVMTGEIDGPRFTKTLMDETTPVVGDKLKHIRAVALYQPKGVLFYSDWGTHSHIGRVNMDGTDARILLDNSMQGAPPVSWPNDIIIDITASSEDFSGNWSTSPMIYFVDAREDYIARTNFDFTEFQYVFKPVTDDSTHIFSIALFEEYIYISEWKNNKKSIFRIHKNCDASLECEAENLLAKSLDQKPMSIVVIDQALQPSLESNPCESKCDQKELCLLKPGSGMTPDAVCTCGDGYRRDSSTGKCVDDCGSFTKMNSDTGNCEEVWKQTKEQGNHCDRGFFTCGGLSNDELAEAERTRDSKYCIAPISLCDGVQDCADGSDEKECGNFDCSVLPGSRRKCSPSGSGNERCVEQSKFCDGTNDCPNNEDEDHSSCKCPSGMYQCKTIVRRYGYTPRMSDCLPQKALCDGTAHCIRRDDEYKCPPPHCRADQYYCVRSLKCISQSQRCDGIINCGYGEDESDCKQLNCDVPDAFQCHKSGKNVCARQAWVCDGRNDCPNNEDEDDALCGDPTYSHPCETGLYCNNKCVLSHQICDGENHCPDGADEENCGCSPEEFSCDADAGPQCIDPNQVCDGKNDCHINPVTQMAADERFCDHDNECKGFLCKTRTDGSAQCIGDQTTGNLECDGNADCQDGSDEAQCSSLAKITNCYDDQLNLLKNVFRCGSGGCISSEFLCDGKNDCADGSDETNNCALNQATCDRDKNACAEIFLPNIGLCSSQNPCQQSCFSVYSDLNGEKSVKCGCHTGYDSILQYSANMEPLDPARLCRGKDGDAGFEILVFSETEMNVVMVNPERLENHDQVTVHEVFNEVAYLGGVLPFSLPDDVVPLRHVATDLKRMNSILIGKKMKISRGLWNLPKRTDADRRGEFQELIKDYYNKPLFWADVDVSGRSHILTDTTSFNYLHEVDVLSVSTFKDGSRDFETLDTETGYIKFSNSALTKINRSLKAIHVVMQDTGVRENKVGVCRNEIVVFEDQFGQAVFYVNNIPFITRKEFPNTKQATQALTNVSSLVQDSYSCKIYWASGSTIWQALCDVTGVNVKPTKLVSLKFWTYKYAGKHTSMAYYHDDIENPVIKMSIFENLLYVTLSDKSGNSAVRMLTVHTRTGEVRPLTNLPASKIVGITLAPWATKDVRIAGQFKEEPLEDVPSICEDGVVCSDQSSAAPMTLSCGENEEVWTSEICDGLIAQDETPEIHKGMSWASVSIAIIIIAAGLGLVYLKRVRENRYKQLPQLVLGGDTVTTTFNDAWSAGEDSRPVENHNPLFHEFNNKGEPKSSTERAGLIENEVTDPDRD